MNSKKSIIYARVSSKEQEDTGYSLDAQEKLLKEYAEKNQLAVKKVFRVSESASGKQIRKTFTEMLRYAENNKISVILCEKIDRLTRNLKDAANISDWINADESREVHFVKESFVVNKNTRAHENLVWDMKVAIARFYTNNLSEEVRKGQKEKLAQGWLPTKPPLGYKTIGEKGHKIHVLDEKTAPLVKRMFELYSTGNYSLNALAQKMYEEGLRNSGGRMFGKSRIHESMSDPFYYGKVRWKGELYPGKHEPLISKELFDEVQRKLNRGLGGPQYRTHLPVFKSKIKCDSCGGTMAWETHKGHWYGHCNHYRPCKNRTWVRQENVEEQLFPLLNGVRPKDSRILDWLDRALKEHHAEEIRYNTSKREELSRIIRIADNRIENAYRDKLDGSMPLTLCEKVIRESTEEKELAIESLSKLNQGRKAYYEAGYAIHTLAHNAEAIYKSEKATDEDRRLLLSYAFSNLTLNGDKLGPNYSLAFTFLAEWIPKLNQTFEPVEIGSIKGKRGQKASYTKPLLTSWDVFGNSDPLPSYPNFEMCFKQTKEFLQG